eukprot:400392-Prorocentrum_lima.AAC.1
MHYLPTTETPTEQPTTAGSTTTCHPSGTRCYPPSYVRPGGQQQPVPPPPQQGHPHPNVWAPPPPPKTSP